MPDESTEIIPAVPYSPPPFAGLREPPSRPPQPADFTREARIASRGRMFDSYAACYPHFAPVEFTRKADGSLEFPDRQPSALRRATDAALSSLLEDWESQARAAVRSTYRTALSPAWSPPVSTGAVRLSPEGLAEAVTAQFGARTGHLEAKPRRWPVPERFVVLRRGNG